MLEDNDITRIYKANVKALLLLNHKRLICQLVKINSIRINDVCLLLTACNYTHFNFKNDKETVCQLEIKLDTGRTHQIRVHLAEIGHPVIGDPLYGDSTLRQLELESYKIEFVHPLTKEVISVSLMTNLFSLA